MITGLLLTLIFGWYSKYGYAMFGWDALPVHYSIIALAGAVIAVIVVSPCTEKNSDSALEKTYTGLYIVPRDLRIEKKKEE